jgi:hypothetical protein
MCRNFQAKMPTSCLMPSIHCLRFPAFDAKLNFIDSNVLMSVAAGRAGHEVLAAALGSSIDAAFLALGSAAPPAPLQQHPIRLSVPGLSDAMKRGAAFDVKYAGPKRGPRSYDSVLSSGIMGGKGTHRYL